MKQSLPSLVKPMAILLAIFLIIYAPYALLGGLLLDDLGFIHPELNHNTYLSYQQELSRFITMTARPISALLHGFAYWNFGSNAALFHGLNLSLFLASIALFALSIQRIYTHQLAILVAIFVILYPYCPATSFASIMMNSNLAAFFWCLALYLSTRTFVGKPVVLGCILLFSTLSYEPFIPLFFFIACTQIVMHRYSFKPQYWLANLMGAVLALTTYGLYKLHIEQWLFQAKFTRVHTHDLSQLFDRLILITQHAFKLMFVVAT